MSSTLHISLKNYRIKYNDKDIYLLRLPVQLLLTFSGVNLK